MSEFQQVGNGLVWEKNHETVRIEAWGKDGLRVRATLEASILDLPQALLPAADVGVAIALGDKTASISNGRIRAEIDQDGHLRFTRLPDGHVLLEERPLAFVLPAAREYKAWRGGLFRC